MKDQSTQHLNSTVEQKDSGVALDNNSIGKKPPRQKKRVVTKLECVINGDFESLVHMDWSSEWNAGRDLL